MQYTTLGKTGMQVSRICLGCMSFGNNKLPGWDWALEVDDAKPFFRRAVELGINFFDTADSYSGGRSEEITGKWLKEFANRDEVVIATKVYFGPSDRPNMTGLSRKHIQQECEASLRRLGVETIDLYQIHRLDPRTPIEETLSALNDLVRQGKVRTIGASSMYAWEFMRALGISDCHGWARFVAMQNHYSLLYREEERDMMPLCEAEGVGVIPWSPLARGILARRNFEETTTRSESDSYIKWFGLPQDKPVVEAVSALADKYGVGLAQVALAWMLSKPAITAPIVGVTKLHHLEDMAAAVDLQLTSDEIEQLEQPYLPKPTIGISPPFASPRPGAVHDRG